MHRRREKRARQTLVLPPPANFPNRTAFQTTSFSTMTQGTSKAAVQPQKVAVAAPGAQIRIWTAAARYVRHGVAEDGSPRREPWGTMRPREKPRQGRQSWVQDDFLSPLRGSNFQYPNPRLTPWATLLPLLRSFLPSYQKRIFQPDPTALGLTAALCAAILSAMLGRKIRFHLRRPLSNSVEFFHLKNSLVRHLAP